MSSFNLFGPATKCDIRVGYIDPDNGYIADLSIHEANKYAKLNPGTVFILKNRALFSVKRQKTNSFP